MWISEQQRRTTKFGKGSEPLRGQNIGTLARIFELFSYLWTLCAFYIRPTLQCCTFFLLIISFIGSIVGKVLINIRGYSTILLWSVYCYRWLVYLGWLETPFLPSFIPGPECKQNLEGAFTLGKSNSK